jgi:hypothetical protein
VAIVMAVEEERQKGVEEEDAVPALVASLEKNA